MSGWVYKHTKVFFLSMVQQPCSGCRRGCLVWSFLVSDTPPTSVEETRQSRRKGKCQIKQKCERRFEDLVHFSLWPASENQGSTPAYRPCRWGSTWRMRSRWCTLLWCSSLGTYNQTAWGAALSAGSSLWYTKKSLEHITFPYILMQLWYSYILLWKGNIPVTLLHIIKEIDKGRHVITQNVNNQRERCK